MDSAIKTSHGIRHHNDGLRPIVEPSNTGRPVALVMTRRPRTANANYTVEFLADALMGREKVSFLPVLEGHDLIGYVDSDLVGMIDEENRSATRVSDIFVAKSPENTVPPAATIRDVFELMIAHGRDKVLVGDQTGLCGVVTMNDLYRPSDASPLDGY